MAEEASPTPSRLLELNEERAVVREGFRFLDEKLLLLAAETLRELRKYEEVRKDYLSTHVAAAGALIRAIERHGLDELLAVPAPTSTSPLDVQRRSFLGVWLQDASLGLHGAGATRSAEAQECADAFRALVERAAALAALTGNLERLLVEYRRTARRARALEDVILPELDASIGEVSNRLEEIDQEEAVRAHHRRSDT